MALYRFLQPKNRLLFHHRPLPPILCHLCLLNRRCSNLSPLGHQPDRRSPPAASGDYIPLIQSCSTKSRLLQIHAHLLRSGLISHSTVSAAFLTRAALAPVSDLDYTRLVFRQIRWPNIYQCNALLRGYAESGSHAETFTFYNCMRQLGIRGNSFSSSFLLKSCASIRSLPGGRQVHCRVIRQGNQDDSVLLTSLMGLYSSCKECDDARRIFDEMPFRDTVTWNVLISCYADNLRSKDALHLFELMLSSENGPEPDDVTCLILLQVCGQWGAHDFGKRIHEYASRHGFDLIPTVQNSLVAMYSKCGCVDKAHDVFHAISHKTVVSWSAMISGLAMNGHGRDAINAFGAMQNAGVTPDEHTFTGVLSACSHSGFVDEGSRFFDMIRDKYRIAPNVCHYGCMVDLLGRAGLLDQAYEFIAKEKCARLDARTWRTLLGACRIHGNTELGERIIEHLVELKAQEAGDYVLLLNTYASAGNWDRVAEMRKLMKDKGIQTSPGCSTIELNGELHEFIVDDDSHPQKGEVYRMLDEITSQLKKAGYVANVSSELHDMDMEDKGSALSCHSEKLAIAFGILATYPGRTLRIAKNLRTCVDCHNFAKFVSFTYNRLVIIRDRNRFHHFKDGHCSCNDYW